MSTLTDDQERQPLLPPKPPTIENYTTGNVTVTAANDGLQTDVDANNLDPQEKTYLWAALWYLVLVVAGAVAVAFFIKGFIEAGDVDVGLL